jgi:hypothetical protein
MEDVLTEIAKKTAENMFSSFLNKVTGTNTDNIKRCKQDITRLKEQYIQIIKDKLILENKLKECISSDSNYPVIIGILIFIIVVLGILFMVNMSKNQESIPSKVEYQSPES